MSQIVSKMPYNLMLKYAFGIRCTYVVQIRADMLASTFVYHHVVIYEYSTCFLMRPCAASRSKHETKWYTRIIVHKKMFKRESRLHRDKSYWMWQ